MLSYEKYGKSITGETYIKETHGPVSKNIIAALNELKSEGAIIERDAPFYNRMKREYVTLKEPDVSEFSSEEMLLTDEVIDWVCQMTAKEVSELTHNWIWEITEDRAEIQKELFLVRESAEPNEDDITWALNAVKEKKWLSVGQSAV